MGRFWALFFISEFVTGYFLAFNFQVSTLPLRLPVLSTSSHLIPLFYLRPLLSTSSHPYSLPMTITGKPCLY